jgi:4-amino-4-deoxy-L-arabinose transferase-like glycosyltransferase
MAKPAMKRKPEQEEASPSPASAVAALPEIGSPDKPSLARVLTPRILLDSTPAEWLFKQSAEKRHLILLAGLCVAIFVPYLGAVGFWDPWEPHYGEVARSMVVRQDYVHPYWESSYFFSKPIMSLWMMAVGMLLAGTNNPAGLASANPMWGGTSLYTEWCVRSMFALVALGGVLFTYLAVARTMSRRAAIWSAVVLATSPFYFLLARQAMVDMPFVAFNTMAISCLMIAVFEKEQIQDGWLYAFYALVGISTLAKGLLGIAMPGAAMLGYLIFTGDWRLLARLRLLTGPLVSLAVMGPWYGTMFAFDGKDDEWKGFFERFIIHDHFKRMGAGVHTTTPNTTFVYFIEQLGFGMFPWVAAIPGALANMATWKLVDRRTRQQKARIFVIAWAVTTFTFFALSSTKFHHYIFPAVPALAILIGLWIERVLEEGITIHALGWVAGGIAFALVAQNLSMTPKHFVDLFVYNYERPYPQREVNEMLTSGMTLFGKQLKITTQLVFSTFFAVAAVAALFGAPMLRTWVASVAKLRWTPQREDSSDRLYVVGALAILAVVFSIYISAYHWRKLSHHWTQRDLFWVYYSQAKPSEPIGAYQMNWRGETFYSRNTVRQLKESSDLREFVETPGREWVLVEHSRLSGLKSAVPAKYKVKVVEKNFTNKFALVVVDDEAPAPTEGF